MNWHELVSGWYHLALDPEASMVFLLKQRATCKSGHQSCRTNVFVCPEIARQFIEERMIFSPNRSQFGGSRAREIGQALDALLESSLQLWPFAVQDREHDGIANVTGPGETIPAQDAFPDGAQLGHGRLTAPVTRIDP